MLSPLLLSPGSVGTGILWKTVCWLRTGQQDTCEILPRSPCLSAPCALLHRQSPTHPASDQRRRGEKGSSWDTAVPCQGRSRHSTFQGVCFACVPSQMYIHRLCPRTRPGSVCEHVRTPHTPSEAPHRLNRLPGGCRQSPCGKGSAGSISRALLGSQRATAFRSAGTRTPCVRHWKCLRRRSCAAFSRADGNSRSSCRIGWFVAVTLSCDVACRLLSARPLRCTAEQRRAELLPLPPLHRVTFSHAWAGEERVFRGPRWQSPSALERHPGLTELGCAKPFTFLPCDSNMHLPAWPCRLAPLSSSLWASQLDELPDLMPVPAAFICHRVLQDPTLGPSALWFPIACGVSCPHALPPSPPWCHPEMKVKGCSSLYGVRDRVSWQRSQSVAELDHDSGGMPRDTGHRHPGESGALAGLRPDPGAVLWVSPHRWQWQGLQEARQDFKNG